MTRLGDLRQATGQYLGRRYPAAMMRYYLYTKSRHYEPELWIAPSLLRRRGVAIDVGANQGIWTLQLARFAKHVHAFEPNPACFRALEPILPRRASLYPVALSGQRGKAELRFDPGNTGIGTIEPRNTLALNAGIKTVETVEVETACLDDFDFRNIDLVKIDVEGHEEAVLAGAVELLARERPAIVCEIEERHNSGGLARIRDFFAMRNYRAAALNGKWLRDLIAIETEGSTKLAVAGGINNFIFIPVERTDLLLDQ
jgi:FkbM family methyltransferase